MWAVKMQAPAPMGCDLQGEAVSCATLGDPWRDACECKEAADALPTDGAARAAGATPPPLTAVRPEIRQTRSPLPFPAQGTQGTASGSAQMVHQDTVSCSSDTSVLLSNSTANATTAKPTNTSNATWFNSAALGFSLTQAAIFSKGNTRTACAVVAGVGVCVLLPTASWFTILVCSVVGIACSGGPLEVWVQQAQRLRALQQQHSAAAEADFGVATGSAVSQQAVASAGASSSQGKRGKGKGKGRK